MATISYNSGENPDSLRAAKELIAVRISSLGRIDRIIHFHAVLRSKLGIASGTPPQTPRFATPLRNEAFFGYDSSMNIVKR